MRLATLLVQPMLSDLWGQVYLEALISRIPIFGLNRDGLPKITLNGDFGFLVDEPEPDALAETILNAFADLERRALMGAEGQIHIETRYSWDLTARNIASVLERTG